MKIKLKESYGNEFITTMRGNVIRKGEWTELDESDKELDHLLQTSIFDVQLEESEKAKMAFPEMKKKEVPKSSGLTSDKVFGAEDKNDRGE